MHATAIDVEFLRNELARHSWSAAALAYLVTAERAAWQFTGEPGEDYWHRREREARQAAEHEMRTVLGASAFARLMRRCTAYHVGLASYAVARPQRRGEHTGWVVLPRWDSPADAERLCASPAEADARGLELTAYAAAWASPSRGEMVAKHYAYAPRPDNHPATLRVAHKASLYRAMP